MTLNTKMPVDRRIVDASIVFSRIALMTIYVAGILHARHIADNTPRKMAKMNFFLFSVPENSKNFLNVLIMVTFLTGILDTDVRFPHVLV